MLLFYYKMPSYKTEAINIRSGRFSEADKLMTFFTKEHGKVNAIAKSALKPGSRFGGRLEPFSYNSLLLARGRNLDILSQIETIETFHTIRASEARLNTGLYIARVLYCFLEERVRDEGLFLLTLECLRMLKAGDPPAVVARIFDVRFADMEGFLPLGDFPPELKPRLDDLRAGRVSVSGLCQKDLTIIDTVLMPKLCEHVGKDVSGWKRS